ncbi:hypothetical protein LJC19_03160 [Oxalobacter sp. OttesenSCG-928-P03]|nr:hypothetical protein [Oxalobacter sp. OttesenSCG-928-P03]
MQKNNIVIFGTSKVSQLVFAYVQNDEAASLTISGFCVDAAYSNEDKLFGLPVVKFNEVARDFPPDQYKMLVAVGYHGMNTLRAQKCREAEAMGYELISYVHSKASVCATAKLGKNCIVLDNVSIEPFAEVGNNVCVYPNATIAHHSRVLDNVWITSGTVIGGNTVVGKNCFLGINATIGHNIVIGDDNFIGAGAVVTRNTEEKSVHIVPDTPRHRLNTDQFMKLFKFD